MRMTPKISESPLASRKSSAPYDSPLKVWTIQNSSVTRSGQPEQAGRGGAQDPTLIGSTELRVFRDDVDGALVAHVEAVVAAQHHAVGAHGVDEEAQQVRRVRDGVVGEAPEIRLERLLGHALRLHPHALPAGEPAHQARHAGPGVRQARPQATEGANQAAATEQ